MATEPQTVQVARPDPSGAPGAYVVAVARGVADTAMAPAVALRLRTDPGLPARIIIAPDGGVSVDVCVGAADESPALSALPVPLNGLSSAAVTAVVASRWELARVHAHTAPGAPGWTAVPLPPAGTYVITSATGVAYTTTAQPFFIVATFDT